MLNGAVFFSVPDFWTRLDLFGVSGLALLVFLSLWFIWPRWLALLLLLLLLLLLQLHHLFSYFWSLPSTLPPAKVNTVLLFLIPWDCELPSLMSIAPFSLFFLSSTATHPWDPVRLFATGHFPALLWKKKNSLFSSCVFTLNRELILQAIGICYFSRSSLVLTVSRYVMVNQFSSHTLLLYHC